MIADFFFRIRCIILLCLLCGPFSAAFAADRTHPPAGSDTRSLLEGLINRADTEGVSIIVINPSDDSVNATDDDSRYATDKASDMSMEFSAVMKAQSAGVEFKNRLFNKLKSLPFAWDQAVASIKGESPDGNFFGFIRILYWSVFLLLVGGLVEQFLYSRFIVGRYLRKYLKANPQGYLEKLPVLVTRALFRIGAVSYTHLTLPTKA